MIISWHVTRNRPIKITSRSIRGRRQRFSIVSLYIIIIFVHYCIPKIYNLINQVRDVTITVLPLQYTKTATYTAVVKAIFGGHRVHHVVLLLLVRV